MKKDNSLLTGCSITRAVKQIVDMSVGKAEKAIEAIADRDGDEIVKKILLHLPPVKIAAILRQHDFSCPSIISWMMTPDLIVDVLKIDPLFWKNIYNRDDFGNFEKIQSEGLDLIMSLLLNAKNRDLQGAILKQISSDELSLLYLFLPFIEWKIKKNQTVELEDPEIDFGTADHLYEIIRWAAPYVAEQVIDFAYSAETQLLYYVMDMWLEAFHNFEKGRDFASIENDMFLPIE